MKHFQNKIGFDEEKQYKYIVDDLHKVGIFTDDEFEIATNPKRKVEPSKENIDKINVKCGKKVEL